MHLRPGATNFTNVAIMQLLRSALTGMAAAFSNERTATAADAAIADG